MAELTTVPWMEWLLLVSLPSGIVLSGSTNAWLVRDYVDAVFVMFASFSVSSSRLVGATATILIVRRPAAAKHSAAGAHEVLGGALYVHEGEGCQHPARNPRR